MLSRLNNVLRKEPFNNECCEKGLKSETSENIYRKDVARKWEKWADFKPWQMESYAIVSFPLPYNETAIFK